VDGYATAYFEAGEKIGQNINNKLKFYKRSNEEDDWSEHHHEGNEHKNDDR